MERAKASGLIIAIMLALGGIAALPHASAQPGPVGAGLQLSSEGNYTKITTGDVTIIFPRNGTKPFFVWWANNDTSRAYVVHFKGLIEYAEVNGSSFSLTNVAEGTLWQRVIQSANAFDLARAGAAAKGLSVAFEAHSRLMLAAGKVMLSRADLGQVKAMLKSASDELAAMNASVNDPEISQQITAAVSAINAAIVAIEGGRSKGEIQSAISAALAECKRLTQAITERARAMVGEIIEKRQSLAGIAEGFHPALLPFSACKWEMGDVRAITDGSGAEIGIAFNLTLVDAPQRFGFAERNVNLSVRIYSAPVVEVVDAAGDQQYSYSVAAGEMKIDLVVKGWDWNFDPKTVSLINATSITISPALALWVDASSFQVNGSVSELFDELEDVKMAVANGTFIFSAGDSSATLNVKRQDDDAKGLGFQIKAAQKSIAGKLMRFQAPAKLKLAEEGTLGGFFKFVPSAIVVGEDGTQSIANVKASYLSAGNHIKVYISYPYFNGTLIHDPSIGVDQPAGDAAYIVTLGPAGVSSIQSVPPAPSWGNQYELLAASGIVLAGAAILILAVRRHPAAA